MMMNQMRGMGQQVPHGLQHLQRPMQPSQIPQQPQQFPMGMANPGMLQNRPDQRQFPMQIAQPRQPGTLPTDISQLNNQEKNRVMELATKLYNAAPDEQKTQLRMLVQSKITPAQLAELRVQGRDPLILYYQNQAFLTMQKQAQTRMMAARQGMPPNAFQQGPHTGQMNPALMNPLGPQQSAADGQIFTQNLEAIRNEQQGALLAQQAGQPVVPASTGRNSTPGHINVPPPQPTPGNPQNLGQAPRPQQMQPQFTPVQQAQFNVAAAQARAQVANRPMQGQIGGLAGPPSQSPAMNTLTAPMRQPPVPMGPGNPQAINPSGQPMGATLNPNFSHQNNPTRPQAMQGNMNNQAMAAMLASMGPEARANVSSLPENKLRELMAKWQEQQHNSIANGPQGPKQLHMSGIPEQPQAGPLNGSNQFGMANIPQLPGGMIQQGVQQNVIQPGMPNRGQINPLQSPQARVMMDSMDVPVQVLNHPLLQGVSPDTRKWSQLRQWMAQTDLPQTMQAQLNNVQMQQFRQLWEKRQGAGKQMGQMPGAAQPLRAPGPIPPQQINQQGPQLPPGVQIPVTPQDIEQLRKNPKFQQLNDESLMKLAKRIKETDFMRRLNEQQLQNSGAQMNTGINITGQKPPVLTAPPPNPQLNNATTAPQALINPLPRQTPQQKPANIADTNTPTPVAPVVKNPPQNRPSSSNPSPAPDRKNLKRSSPDDVSDAHTATTNFGAQRPPAQTDHRPAPQVPQLPPDQVAKLSPEQRIKYEALNRKHHQDLNSTVEDVNRLKQIGGEEQRMVMQQYAQNPDQDIAMTPEETQETLNKLRETVMQVNSLGRGLAKWFHISKDENRARLYFRKRFRLVRQFADGEKMTTPRATFSMPISELDEILTMVASMKQDLALAVNRVGQELAIFNGQVTAQSQSTGQQPAQRPSQTTPLSAANLEKLKQAHIRTGSKGGQAPAAPTTSQPPFQLGVQKSPTGQPTPTYLNNQHITQRDLQLPPSRKKTKPNPAQSGPPQTSSPATQQATGASPQIKAPSPEVRRQPPPEPAKPLPKTYPCTHTDCDMHTTGFQTEEARDAHIQEEHVKPYEDPVKFVQENLALSLGLDAQGNLKPTPNNPSQEMGAFAAPPMSASVSRQGQTPMSKPDSAATPMSRDASMKRQGSTTGGRAGENMATPGRNVLMNTPKLGDGKLAGSKPELDVPQVTAAPEDLWAQSTIDPQNLFASFAMDTASGTMLSDIGTYRSLTPHDTPESSRASEPNSDISENAHLEIDLQWGAPLDADVLLDMNHISMGGGFDPFDGADIMSGEAFPSSFDEMANDYSKPFQFDTSLYSMDTT
ncbi:hypothetical protein B0T19DRAFT_419270 [Cercophora scortea]|uniref:Uncharacterized protein n=1 Tax=Cercophora scortea TaxID=314031 RepID=A0AAE0J0C7_9PEZI|nr:hypothetical protein B0T19DRAFT_419270 [Cercophora scortea]